MENYKNCYNIRLTRRTPVVLKFDGCHFHTFTRGFKKPFDEIMMKAMQLTMMDLCKNIQNAVIGYTQSDEITIILNDYQTLEAEAWFDNRLNKMTSVGASMASRFFNWNFRETAMVMVNYGAITEEEYIHYESRFSEADFDCCAFNLPPEEVCNFLIFRQKDAERNSIQMLAQSMYKPDEIRGISNKALQDKMFTEKGVNWNNFATSCKRGTACKRNIDGDWAIDYDMPILSRNRTYVDDLVIPKD